MELRNVADYEEAARQVLPPDTWAYLFGGADDLRTKRRNREAYQLFQIRQRVLVNVQEIETSVSLFGRSLASPIILSPVGMQRLFHRDGELATARAAENRNQLMIVSTASNHHFADIAKQFSQPPWFQLYPTSNRVITRRLLETAEALGAPVLVLTVDLPVPGNRESHLNSLMEHIEGGTNLPNVADLAEGETVYDPTMTWQMIEWLRRHCSMKIVLKGIMTAEDAKLAVQFGVDGIIVSNHGGRQLESDMGTIEALPEVVAAINGQMPVLIDGGIRRGTDIFKALALGATACCIGRPFCYGLAVDGDSGVAAVLEILEEELVRNMRLAGTPSLADITANSIRKKASGGSIV